MPMSDQGRDQQKRCGRHRPEHPGLDTQDRQVADRLTTVSEHHRNIDCDASRVMADLPTS